MVFGWVNNAFYFTITGILSMQYTIILYNNNYEKNNVDLKTPSFHGKHIGCGGKELQCYSPENSYNVAVLDFDVAFYRIFYCLSFLIFFIFRKNS